MEQNIFKLIYFNKEFYSRDLCSIAICCSLGFFSFSCSKSLGRGASIDRVPSVHFDFNSVIFKSFGKLKDCVVSLKKNSLSVYY